MLKKQNKHCCKNIISPLLSNKDKQIGFVFVANMPTYSYLRNKYQKARDKSDKDYQMKNNSKQQTRKNNEIRPSSKARLYTDPLTYMTAETIVIDYGAIIICRKGNATMWVDFKEWSLHEGAVITLFPNDVVKLCNASGDFLAEVLRYDPALLREASLQLEETVYSALRKDRCRRETPVVTNIVDTMFNLLRIYFSQQECTCLDQMVLFQLKAFFLGFYDWTSRNKQTQLEDDTVSRRVSELFNMFMEQLEKCYRQSHDVAFYAQLLNITPKYLCNIVQQKTQHTPKDIIDQYVVLQIKLTLSTTDKSIKQIAWDYHFSDDSFFCRYFKRHTGITPQQFRKQV